MSGFAASLMSTPYFRTNQRITACVCAPCGLAASAPMLSVSSRFGRRYCGRTGRRWRTETAAARRPALQDQHEHRAARARYARAHPVVGLPLLVGEEYVAMIGRAL